MLACVSQCCHCAFVLLDHIQQELIHFSKKKQGLVRVTAFKWQFPMYSQLQITAVYKYIA